MDQNADPTFEVFREIVAERPALASMVKSASVGDEVRDGLPMSAFADPARREFPVHSAEHALLSRAYAEKVGSVSEPILRRINDAMTVFGVQLPSLEFRKVAEVETPDYLLPHTEQFPVYADTSLKLAYDAIARNSRKLAPTSLATAATKLVKHAAARDEDLPIGAYQWAGLVPCDREKAAEWIEARGPASNHPHGFDAYPKVAALVRALPFNTERGELTKIAEVIGDLDKVFGLNKHYGKSLPDPLQTVFNTKEAMGAMVDLGGTPVPLATLVKQSPEFYGDLLGPDVVEEISADGIIDPSKIQEIFPTLPRDMHHQLKQKLGLDSGGCGGCGCG
jgi:hypothetical protein